MTKQDSKRKAATMTKHTPLPGPGTIENLARWVLGPRAGEIPQAAVKQAKLLVLDTIGCGYAALEEDSARAVLATLADLGGAPQCSVIGRAIKTSAPNAVLVNGALIRILDLNDYVNNRKGEIGGHPSDNIPVALAAGEMCGSPGRELIAAIVLGYEIFGRAKELMERDSGWDGVTISPAALWGSMNSAWRKRWRSAARARQPRWRCATAPSRPPSRSRMRWSPRTACRPRCSPATA
jgi:2-methylcitrate dehydratase PrpD